MGHGSLPDGEVPAFRRACLCREDTWVRDAGEEIGRAAGKYRPGEKVMACPFEERQSEKGGEGKSGG
jgi:hypothetical protein